MSMKSLTSAYNLHTTPQSEPIPGSTQTANAAGGFGWDVDDWQRLDRFLILGSEGGTYYTTERKLTRENAEGAIRCVAADGPRVVRRVVEVSEAGRAPRNDPAIFALALAMKLGDDATRREAHAAVPRVCRIGTHLFALAEAVQAFGGWGRGTRRAFGDWYTRQEPAALAYNLIKYQNRNGWTNRDILRLAKPAGHNPDSPIGALLHWATRGWPDIGTEPHPNAALRRVWAFERAKVADARETVALIREYDLPRECVATAHLNEPAVWDALLHAGRGMPLHALVRNLAKMTACGLVAPLSEAAVEVVRRLGDAEEIRRARLHPLALLTALRTYASGHGEKGSLTWAPVGPVVDALDAAFYLAFASVVPTGKRTLIAVDVSGSMSGTTVAGLSSMRATEAAAALALVTAATEPNHAICAFDTAMHALTITPRQRLTDATAAVDALVNGGTDCAQPILWATHDRIPVDVFVILTDSETWQGNIHPAQAIRAYRQALGINAKMAVVAMCSNQTSIADPGDGGVLNVVGFDTSVPEVLRAFAV